MRGLDRGRDVGVLGGWGVGKVSGLQIGSECRECTVILLEP